MARYILKRRTADACATDVVAALEGVTVLDSVADITLLIETDPAALERHRKVLDGWTVRPEMSFRLRRD